MATRARIGIQNDDGTIRSVYHHWDGYPEWLGVILRDHFNTSSEITTLVDGGDMSSCRTNLGFSNESRDPAPLYYSERGETCPPRVNANFDAYMLEYNAGEEYNYLFVDNEWKCYRLKGEMEGYTSYDEKAIPEGDL